MIEVQLAVREGCIQKIEVHGHAPREGAISLCCGIVSSIVKGFALGVHELGIPYSGHVEGVGHFQMTVMDSYRKELLGMSALVSAQLTALCEAYPEYICMQRKEL